MHTLILTASGLIVLFVFVFVSGSLNKRKAKPPVNGAYMFIWLWLVVSIVDFCIGVFVEGYSAAMELGVHLIIFGVPAAVAWYLSRKFRSEMKKTTSP